MLRGHKVEALAWVGIVVVWVALAIVIASFVSSAGAHITTTSYEDWSKGNDIARSDCGRAWDWTCSEYPYAIAREWICGDHTRCVKIGYRERHFGAPGTERFCTTETHWYHGGLSYRHKEC